ncbi:MAG TPA: OsmC family protein [Thermoanaerobaculia bacterium]|nr:OsmC family protein [Thermoanaerobaculia bacterium]
MTFPGGVAVDAQYKGHTIHTDQPTTHGGGGTAPAPFDLFLASIGTCAGFYALRFCQQRELPTEGLRVALETEKNEGRVAVVRLEVELPEAFPDKYRSAILRAIDQCTVKKHIVEPPEFEVDLLVREESAVATAAVAGAAQPPGRNTQ